MKNFWNNFLSEPHDADLDVVQKLSVQIQEERKRLGESEKSEMLFKKYVMLEDYTCKDKKVTLRKGSIVEVLDTEKEDKWLVRFEKDKHQVRDIWNGQPYIEIQLLGYIVTLRL